jgi:hypothetical protein
MLANGDTVQDLLDEYTSLSREDIMPAWITLPSWRKSKSPRSPSPAIPNDRSNRSVLGLAACNLKPQFPCVEQTGAGAD